MCRCCCEWRESGVGTHSKCLGSSPPNHGRIIRSQILEQPPHLFLIRFIHQRVGRSEQGAGRGSGGEPVSSGETSEEGEEVGLKMREGEEGGDLVDRVGGLWYGVQRWGKGSG